MNPPIMMTTIKKLVKQANYDNLPLVFFLRNIKINGENRGCSGHIKNSANGHCVYINTEICRKNYFDGDNRLQYLYRKANDEKDFHGYGNQYSTLAEMPEHIINMLQNGC